MALVGHRQQLFQQLFIMDILLLEAQYLQRILRVVMVLHLEATLTQHFTYDGSSWTLLPAAVPTQLGAATGAPDNAIGFYQPGASLLWDGSTWSTNPVTGAYTPPAGLGRASALEVRL